MERHWVGEHVDVNNDHRYDQGVHPPRAIPSLITNNENYTHIESLKYTAKKYKNIESANKKRN
jgi:hypothetical protein